MSLTCLAKSDKLVNIELTDLLKAKNEQDYLSKVKLLKAKVSGENSELVPTKIIHGNKWVSTDSNKTYIAFIEQYGNTVVYIGSTDYYYRVIWSLKDKTTHVRYHTKEYGYGISKLCFRDGDTVYELPKSLEKSFNKLAKHADNI